MSSRAVPSVYLDPRSCGIEWLLDPEQPNLRSLAIEATGRAPADRCDAHALARDAELLVQVLSERHFGAATGIADGGAAVDVVNAWRDLLDRGHRTWGEAVAPLQSGLREALRDEHIKVLGAPAQTDNRGPEDDDGPAVEERVVDGVLVLRVRRLIGARADELRLAEWTASADRHFAHDRIVIDLRGNRGGNDGHTWRWAERRLHDAPLFARDSAWTVRGSPLGSWNAAAWIEARDGIDAVPPALRESHHDPRPGDRIERVDESEGIAAGDLGWHGRMVVVVDRRTASSGESSAWLLRLGLDAVLVGEPTNGMIEYGNTCPYVLPESGLVLQLPTKHNDFGRPVESVGFPVDIALDPQTPVDDIVRNLDAYV